jgi:protein phosphatase
MGATVVLAVLIKHHVFVANVGDSRAYVLTSDGIQQITHDHTVVASLIEQGKLTKQEAPKHPAHGQLTRNIGDKPTVDAFLAHFHLSPGDVLLLCCDGLTDVVEEVETSRIIMEAPTRQEACHRLVNLANSRGGPDNITVVLMGCPGKKAT